MTDDSLANTGRPEAERGGGKLVSIAIATSAALGAVAGFATTHVLPLVW